MISRIGPSTSSGSQRWGTSSSRVIATPSASSTPTSSRRYPPGSSPSIRRPSGATTSMAAAETCVSNSVQTTGAHPPAARTSCVARLTCSEPRIRSAPTIRQLSPAHRVGTIQSYAMAKEPVLLGGQCLLRIIEDKATNLRALRWTADGRVWPIFIGDEVDRVGANPPPEGDVQIGRAELPVVVHRGPLPEPVPKDRAELLTALGIEEDPAAGASPLVVLVVGDDIIRPFHCVEDGIAYPRKLVVVNDITGTRSGRALSAVTKRVALVGVGSLGSKIAESLVRSGIRRLVLVDGDIFLPGNLERHVLDWRDVGFEKVHAVKRRLLHIAPSAEVAVIETNLDWQRPSHKHSDQLDQLAACDLLVDATGNLPTSLLVGAIAWENARPFVSAEVYEGGLGAVIARSMPDLDPPYAMGRQAYIAYCEEQNVQPPTSGEQSYEAIFDDGVPAVADDAAVSAAAGYAARVVLDILDEKVGEGHRVAAARVSTGLALRAAWPQHRAGRRWAPGTCRLGGVRRHRAGGVRLSTCSGGAQCS